MRALTGLLLLVFSLPAAAGDPAGIVYVGLNRQGAEEWLRVKDGAVVVRVPGGEFLRRPYEGGTVTREPKTTAVKSFFIDRCEVTNARFARFLNAVPDAAKHVDPRVPGLEHDGGVWRASPGRGNHPVTAANGLGALAYAKWVGARLPAPVEWEKAAGGTDGRLYPWGDEAPDAARANFGGEGGPARVGSYAAGASPYGVLDMAGNVYDRVMVRGQPAMLKGGSWVSPHALNLRVLDLCMQPPGVADRSVGFRCVMDDPEPDRPARKPAPPARLKLAKSWDAACAEAKRRGVPIFLSLQFDTCGQCDRTRAQLFRDPRFVAYCNEHLVVAVGHRAAPQPGVENHEENEDGTCPLYPGLVCADHHDIFAAALDVVKVFRVSPGNFVLAPDGKTTLVKEAELPKWGNAVEAYLAAFERARAAATK
jgi:formylglycine-generating enzyme required for sulfatase activity